MKKKDKLSISIFLIFVILLLGNMVFLILSFQLFPAYGGFTRQIIFIKPDNKLNSGGYILILDELDEKSQNFEIDWLLHSRGELIIAPDQQSVAYSVQSYLSDDVISLNVSFLEEIDRINSEEGVFCPKNYRENDNYPDVDTTYIKASYMGRENPQMVTLLAPKNDSDNTQKFPQLEKYESGLRRIGDRDYLFYSRKSKELNNQTPNLSAKCKIIFLRIKKNNSDSLDYFYLDSSEYLEYENNLYFESQDEVSKLLVNYGNDSQISGYIETSSNKITLRIPFEIKSFKLNGKAFYDYEIDNEFVSFNLEDSSSFVISLTNQAGTLEDNPLRDESFEFLFPERTTWEIDNSLFYDVKHPFILFNNNNLESIREKIRNQELPWGSWYADYIRGDPLIEDALSRDLNSYEDDQRYHNVYKLALKFAIEDNVSCFNKLREYLMDMDSITHYSQDLRRAYNVQAYVIGFDFIYNNLSQSEREQIHTSLTNHAEPLTRMNLYHRNNHRVVDAGALGLAGLVLHNPDFVNIAIETCLDYFYNVNPSDGGSFEGYSYMSFAIIEMIQLAIGLKNLNEFNFFEDPKFIASLDYIAETLGPLGMPGSFEDCTFSKNIQEVLLISAAHIFEQDPEKAMNYQYVWEQRQNNNYLNSSSEFGYLKGADPSFRRILCYNVDNIIPSLANPTKKEIWKESSMAYLSYGGKDGFFIPFSCKNYDQNHPHQDENSFELWAYGAYLVNNPGYPGWGKKYHTWSQSTEGSNSILIGGEGQLQVIADGLTFSISSPYFSTVIGSANEIYNDSGSFQYAPEFYYLLGVNFLLLGIIIILTLLIIKRYSNGIVGEKNLKNNEEGRKNKQDLNSILIERNLFSLGFSSPFTLQKIINFDELNKNRLKSLNRHIYLLLASIVGIVFVVSCIDVNLSVIYHSQYHEDKYNIIFDILPFAILMIYIIGTIIVVLLAIIFAKSYARLNKSYLQIIAPFGTNIDSIKLKSISMASFLWIFPMLIIGGALIYFITVQGLKGAIHGLWTELNSINDVYQFIVVVLIDVIRIFGLSFIVGIICIGFISRLFVFGSKIHTKNTIGSRTLAIISLINLSIIFIVIFSIYITFYLIFKSIFSLITIEAIVN